MRKLLILFLLSFTFINKAQTNWPPVGTEWYYTYAQHDIDELYPDGYFRLKVEGDTIISDTICRKLVILRNVRGYEERLGYEFIYSNNKQVYNYHHGQFNLLYDFDAEVGDELELSIDTRINLGRLYTSTIRRKIIHKVTAKDSIELGGKKFMYLDLSYNESDYYDLMFSDGYMHFSRIIEGIGGYYFLFGRYSMAISGENHGPLRCFNDGTISYSNGTPCDYLPTGMESNEESGLVQIMQNPAIETLSLRINEQAISIFLYLEIIDITGTILFQQKVEGSEISIPVSNLPNGVYMYRVVGEETVSGMFLKE